MTKPDPHAATRQQAKAELARRAKMAAQKAEAEEDLLAFVRMMWPVIEPETPLIEGFLLDLQADILMAVTDEHLTRVCENVPPGSMKALDVDTPILTTWGWKRHGDLVAGDFVFGPDGKPKKVLGVTEHVTEPVFAVRFDDSATLIAGAGHLWSIERDHPYGGPQSSRCRKPAVVATPDLIPSVVGRALQRPDRIPIAPGAGRPA